jgi:uncharacterized protein YbjT (DUF2867 family)
MNVLVAGASGKTGKLVVELLLEQDHFVVAMVRSREKMKEMEKMGAKPVLTDLEFDVDFAVEGMEAVVFAAGSGPGTGPEKTRAVDQDGAIKLIEACEKNSVGRFVMLSAIGVDKPEEGPEELKTYLHAKRNADKRLMKSNINYTIIRASSLSDNEEKGTVTAARDLDLLESHGQHDIVLEEISRKDIANILVNALETPSTYRKVIEVTGGFQPINQALKSL